MNKCIINLKNIRFNISQIKNKLKKGTKFCAVLKADAYGHGALQVGKAIADIVDYMAVATISEGLKLRHGGITTPILVLGALDRAHAKSAINNNLTLTITSLEDAKFLAKIAKDFQRAKVHIKVNTGMNRIGINCEEELIILLNYLKKCKKIEFLGVFSHFSASDNEKYTKMQVKKFNDYKSLCSDFSNLIFHISSSFATLNSSDFNYDMVRVGFSMYGYSYLKNQPLKKAMTVTSSITSILNVKKGEYIGYAKAAIAKKDMSVACVGIGYADGLHFRLGDKACVKINNHLCKILGRICMDVFLCDVTGVTCKVGQGVTIFDDELDAFYWAKLIGTREYEILTTFCFNRIKRVYI